MSNTPNVRKMTRRAAIAFYSTVQMLDGHAEDIVTENVKTGDKNTTRKIIPFQFGKPDDSGKLLNGSKIRYNAARNLAILKEPYDAFVKARDGHINQLSNGKGSIEKDDPNYTEVMLQLNRELERLLDDEVDVIGLLDLPYEYLNLDGNPNLSPTIISALLPLISGLPTE